MELEILSQVEEGEERRRIDKFFRYVLKNEED
jgi:hypothetical protein